MPPLYANVSRADTLDCCRSSRYYPRTPSTYVLLASLPSIATTSGPLTLFRSQTAPSWNQLHTFLTSLLVRRKQEVPPPVRYCVYACCTAELFRCTMEKIGKARQARVVKNTIE